MNAVTLGMTKKTIKFIKNSDLRIKTEDILLFDLDGTLVDTDFSNFLSYQKAVKEVTGQDISMDYCFNSRFDRNMLERIMPNLTCNEYKRIIQLKNENYEKNLCKTQLNTSVADILKKYSKTNQTVLVTNCRKDRALMTIKFYGLNNFFSFSFFHNNYKNDNKYLTALSNLKTLPDSVFVFENDKSEINNAINCGIPCENIKNVSIS
ncbi:MAG: HAD hydrolase-like protein [Desulfobacteraceae bacterium]|nr:HAD hydrolase-like protein [Desulfobacteraceae bacterium]